MLDVVETVFRNLQRAQADGDMAGAVSVVINSMQRSSADLTIQAQPYGPGTFVRIGFPLLPLPFFPSPSSPPLLPLSTQPPSNPQVRGVPADIYEQLRRGLAVSPRSIRTYPVRLPHG